MIPELTADMMLLRLALLLTGFPTVFRSRRFERLAREKST